METHVNDQVGVIQGGPVRPEDETWMRRALELAREGRGHGEVPVGALLVQGQQVLGEGFNQPVRSHDPTAHAEIVAMRAASAALGNYRLTDTTLYVTIEPCAMCAGALIHARVSRLVFGATEPKAGAVCSHIYLLQQCHMNWQVQFTGGVLADECSALMRDFFAARR